MATKSTHKKKKFNKRDLAKKLDRLAEKVSSKDIYVVGRNEEYYTVVDYKTGKITFNHLPTRTVANKLCNRVNRKKLPKEVIKEIYKLLQQYYYLRTDTEFYNHTIANTSSEVTLDAALARLDLSIARMQNIISKILSKC